MKVILRSEKNKVYFFAEPDYLEHIREISGNFLKTVEITIKKQSKPRTSGEGSQNNKIHALCVEIAQHTGQDMEEVKLYAKYRAVKRGYPLKLDSQGFPIVSVFTGLAMPESSARVSTVEASFLIDELEQIKAEYC